MLVKKSSSAVRFCVSSRPEQEINWSIGRSANSLNSILRLEEHTRHDITRLARHEIDRLASLVDSRTQEELVDHLSTRANGLFMWVKVASRDIVRSCMNGVAGTSEDLLARLNILPDEINALYLRILQRRMDEATHNEGLCMLGVVAFGRKSFSLREFGFILTGRENNTKEEQASLRRRIDAFIGGLLEHRSGRIVFTHETVGGFVRNLIDREPDMLQLVEAHHKLANACLWLLLCFESKDSQDAASKTLSSSDGFRLRGLTRYSTYNWLYHVTSARDIVHHETLRGPPPLISIGNEQILHWQEIYLARCWERPLLMGHDCHPARTTLALLLFSVTTVGIFSLQEVFHQ